MGRTSLSTEKSMLEHRWLAVDCTVQGCVNVSRHEQALFEGAPFSSIRNRAEQGLLANIAFLERGPPFLVLLHAGKGSAP
jgi:hypothetical protein